MLIDTHCHLSYEDYDNLDEVIKNMDGLMVASGCNDKTNKEVLELVNKYPNIYGTLGIHPEDVDNVTSDSFKLIEENINNPKIVAIGEIGLDYYWTVETKEKQKENPQRDFPGGTEVQTPGFHCRRHGFNPWPGN